MKVEEPDEYLKVENLWQKIHQARLKEGMIIGWAVYEIMNEPAKHPYNFVTISWYDSFSKLDDGIPDKIYEAAYPEKSKEEWEAFNARTERSRKLVNSGVFYQRLSCIEGLDNLGNFYMINEIHISRERSKEFLRINEEIYKPLYAEDIRNNNRTNWSLWAKWPGDTKDFQYVSADGYSSMEEIQPMKYLDYFHQIHPNKNPDQIERKLDRLRTSVNSEMWRTIYRILK